MQVNIINLKHAISICKEMCVNLFIPQKNILCLKVACFVLLDLTESVRRRQLTFVHISFIGKTLYQKDTFQLFQYCRHKYFC